MALLQKLSCLHYKILKAVNRRGIGVKQEKKLFKWKPFERLTIQKLYRAIDQSRQTLDWMLIRKRNAKAAKRFFKKLLSNKQVKDPYVVNVDKNPAFCSSPY